MDGLIGILCLGAAVGSWWWIAGRMKKGGRGWLTRNMVGSFAGCLVAIIVASIALALGVVEPKKQEQAVVVEAVKPSKVVAEKTLKMTPAMYAGRINQLLEKFEKPYRVNPDAVTKGEVQDILKANLGPYASLVAAVSKDTGELVDVTLIGAGNGTPASGMEVMLIASAALAAAAPEADYRDVFKKLPKLLDGSEETYGQVKLNVKSTELMGHWFMAAPI